MYEGIWIKWMNLKWKGRHSELDNKKVGTKAYIITYLPVATVLVPFGDNATVVTFTLCISEIQLLLNQLGKIQVRFPFELLKNLPVFFNGHRRWRVEDCVYFLTVVLTT